MSKDEKKCKCKVQLRGACVGAWSVVRDGAENTGQNP